MIGRRLPLLALPLVLGGCSLLFSGQARDWPERSELASEPAAALRFPEAEELAHVANEARSTIEGPFAAFDGRIYGSQATQEDIFAFYERELANLGWQRDEFAVFTSSGELDSWGWCKPSMIFRLAIKKPGNFREEFYRGKEFVTVFEGVLIGREAEKACPTELRR